MSEKLKTTGEPSVIISEEVMKRVKRRVKRKRTKKRKPRKFCGKKERMTEKIKILIKENELCTAHNFELCYKNDSMKRELLFDQSIIQKVLLYPLSACACATFTLVNRILYMSNIIDIMI